jgi:SNF2 family DNA or RNA helicase
VVSCKAEQLSCPVDIYDLQLAGCPHFFAGDVLVHNCTFVKNPSAARSKRTVQLARLARYRRIMTGSPVTRSPLDVYGQMAVLQERPLGFSSYYSFRARYAVTKKMDVGGRKFDVVVGYREVDDLQKRLAPHAFRVTKAECLDLPPKVYLRRDVELTDEQRRLYDEMKTYAMAEITAGGPVVQATTVITQILRLHQLVCGYVVDEDGVEHPVGSARVEALLETVEEAPGKVIVWSRYRRCIADVVAALTKAYGLRSVVEYHGGTSAAERAAAVARFQGTGETPHDPECRFIVSNPQVGGFGNTWTRGTTEVFYANSYDLELRVQAEDRPHRAGQTESVTIVDLVAPGTVDEKILKALREKINLASAVLGEAYREWLI